MDDHWDHNVFAGHTSGVNAVSWAPASSPGSLSGAETELTRSFASAGGDNLVKVWTADSEGRYNSEDLEVHTDWVRDVAWAPNIGTPV